MPYSRPYASGFQDFPSTTTPINATALNTMDVGIKTANDQFQTVTTAQRTALTPTVGQAVWDSDLKQLMVYMNASGGNAWQPVGNTIVCTSTTRPSTPFEGQQIRETDTNRELVYSGSAWVQTNSWSTTSGVTGVNNLIVPPTARVKRETDLTGYTSNTAITWSNTAVWDTDGMWSSGAPTVLTIQTAGIYVVEFALYWTATATVTSAAYDILVGGAKALETGGGTPPSSTGAFTSMCGTFSLGVGETLSASVTFSGGSAYVIKGGGGSSIGVSRLTATWIGRTS